MPTLEEVFPNVAELTKNVDKLGLDSEAIRGSGSDDESDDEFHDACDRVSNPGERGEKDEVFTEAELLELIAKGEASKSEGNQLYVKEQWQDAKARYLHGLTCAPKRNTPLTPPPPVPNADADTPVEQAPVQDEANTPTPTEIETRAAALRAQLYCNIGACCVNLNDHEGAVKACTEALIDDPKYVKALQRRAASNEIIGTWSALSSAEADYTTLLDLLPPKDQPPTRRALTRVKPRAEEAKTRETAEMMGKLKDLGNSLLGRFGLSTDNFQFTPNGQGGYGMNFVR
ncbi:hypothetical protein BDV93DRAFT_544283 [Ceratobasidium sp. AG-I]|nr:hypothetical protein BDV93DRAFT_544283 [Ceratobasidium sp. AG-I]